MDVSHLAMELIRIDTSTGKSTAHLADFLQHYLAARGFRVEKQCFLDSNHMRQCNLVASMGTGPQGVLFSGHLDTVPPSSDEGSGPWIPRQSNGKIYGLGAADMKGAIASMICAIQKVSESTLEKQVVLLLTANEEWDFSGAIHAMKSNTMSPKYLVIGEPTELQLALSHKGYASFAVDILGRAGHASMPANGVNAIDNAVRYLNAISDLKRSYELRTDNRFNPPYSTINVGTIRGGDMVNKVPGSCAIGLEFRAIPGVQNSEIVRDLHAVAARLKQMDNSFEYALRVVDNYESFSGKADSLTDRLAELHGLRVTSVPYCCESHIYRSWDVPTIITGPGSIEQAHRKGEFVDLESLSASQKIYESIIREVCVHAR